MSLREVCSADWAVIDLGGAAPLKASWHWEWHPARPWALLLRIQWQAEGPPPYETPAYSPPEVRLLAWAGGQANEHCAAPTAPLHVKDGSFAYTQIKHCKCLVGMSTLVPVASNQRLCAPCSGIETGKTFSLSLSGTQAILHLPATAAWDIWSLGCTLYEAATGTILFGGLEEVATSVLAAGMLSGGEDSDEHAGEGPWNRRPHAAGAASALAHQQRLERMADEAHLALMRRLLGPPPLRMLERSPVASLFFDERGELRHLVAPGRRPLDKCLGDTGTMDPQQVGHACCAGLAGA